MQISYQQFLYWSTTLMDVCRGERSRSYYVIGHVRSGTNWLCNMLSDYYDLPVNSPWEYYLPQTSPRIFHLHRFLPFETFRKRAIYVLRDGRDTCISRYFHALKNNPREKASAERFMNKELKADNLRENLGDFLRWASTYRGSCLDWKSHVQKWKQKEYVTVKYEDMLADPAKTVGGALGQLLGEDPDPVLLAQAVEKNVFAKLAKRQPGQESKENFFRKGVAGDWKNYFTKQDAEFFDRYAGEELILAGYESDHDWVDRIPD